MPAVWAGWGWKVISCVPKWFPNDKKRLHENEREQLWHARCWRCWGKGTWVLPFPKELAWAEEEDQNLNDHSSLQSSLLIKAQGDLTGEECILYERVLKAYEAEEYLGDIFKGSKSSQLEKLGAGYFNQKYHQVQNQREEVWWELLSISYHLDTLLIVFLGVLNENKYLTIHLLMGT